MRIINYDANYRYKVPVFGSAADIAAGALMKAGATAGTDFGAAIKCAGDAATANVDIVGILKDNLDYSVDGETLGDGTDFAVKEVEPVVPWRVIRLPYSTATADLISATQAVSTTTITLTSLEDNIDASFLYVVSGLGAGQTNFLTASAAGSATLKAAFTTALDTTSRLIKILRRFHPLCVLSSADSNKLGSIAAAGGTGCFVLDTFIKRGSGGRLEQMDPTIHDDLTGLNSLDTVQFWADVCFRDTLPYTID